MLEMQASYFALKSVESIWSDDIIPSLIVKSLAFCRGMFLPHVNFQWTVFLSVYEAAHCVAENSATQYQARNVDGKKILNIHAFRTCSGQDDLPLG